MDLLTCPFCGAPAEVNRSVHSFIDGTVHCGNLNGTDPDKGGCPMVAVNLQPEFWNRRAYAPSTPHFAQAPKKFHHR
jgi:hypothetical protein